jgi:dihydropteroate synthase
MGILNITPDSFYDGGHYKDEASILHQVETMLNEGATFIDVGGYSSRPGADFVSENEELARVIPVIKLILEHFPDTLISVDTFRSQVAKQAIEAGAAMINDISAGYLDDEMITTVGQLGVPYIMMHMRGNPKTMQQHTNYNDLIKDINLS